MVLKENFDNTINSTEAASFLRKSRMPEINTILTLRKYHPKPSRINIELELNILVHPAYGY